METRRFRPSQTVKIALLILVLVFHIGGWVVATELMGDIIAWAFLALTGILVIIQAILLNPNAQWLELDDLGFVTCTMFKRQRTWWRDVEEFGVARHQNRDWVTYNYVPGSKKSRSASQFCKMTFQYDRSLPSTFGQRADQLAALMEQYKTESRNSLDRGINDTKK